MVTLDWSTILYKNPCPTTLSFNGSILTDNRFKNYKSLYSAEHMVMLNGFENFQITSTVYDSTNPWTYAVANSQEDFATHLLRKENFANGTVRIIKPGYYKLMDDITFSPNEHVDDTLMPTNQQITAGDYPTVKTTPSGYYHMGFFAAITVECANVVLDLNGHVVRQSELHRLQQRFFACIETASAPFIPNAGPSEFGQVFSAAENLYICNGSLKTSSHHSIHGNNNKNVVIENLTLANFEVGGIQLNGGSNVLVRNINVCNGSNDIVVKATYSQGRFLMRFLEQIKNENSNYNITFSQKNGGGKNIGQIITNLKNAMNQVVADVKAKRVPSNELFVRESRLLDGNKYGMVFAQKGPVVGPFAQSRHPDKMNEGLVLHDLKILNLETNSMEVLAISSDDHNSEAAYGGARQSDAVGGIFRIRDVVTEDGKYKSDPLADAQLIVAKYGLEQGAPLGKTGITQDTVDWATGQSGKTVDQLIDGVSRCYIGLGDSMGHAMKGDIGLFIQGALNVKTHCIEIAGMHNHTTIGAQYVDFNGYPDNNEGKTYKGSASTGIALVASHNVNLNKTTISNICSDVGEAQGIKCLNQNQNVQISDYDINSVKCGLTSMEGLSPNPMVNCDCIGISPECFDEISLIN